MDDWLSTASTHLNIYLGPFYLVQSSLRSVLSEELLHENMKLLYIVTELLRGFIFTQISGHSPIKILEVLKISNFRAISVYIDVIFICFWYKWGQNVLSYNSACKNSAHPCPSLNYLSEKGPRWMMVVHSMEICVCTPVDLITNCNILLHSGLATTSGDIKLDQHWLR